VDQYVDLQARGIAVDTPSIQRLTFIERAGRWFLHSGIQEASGGVARYYRVEEQRNQPISTEITGYFAGTLVELHGLTGERQYLDAAARAGRYLARCAWDSVLLTFPFETPGGLAYFFDCGIILRGLLALWRVTGDANLLDISVRCAESMAMDFAGNGEFHPVLALPGKAPVARDDRWSRRPGCYQLKSALAWHELANVTGESRFDDYFYTAVEIALASHETFLPGSDSPEKVMDRLHAYCYFLEGLLGCQDQERHRSALWNGILRVQRLLYEIAPSFERSDVYAQLLRLRLFADATGVLPLDRRRAAQEAAMTAGYQIESADPRTSGGFGFGRRTGIALPFVNPVSTAFGVQALVMWNRFQEGGFIPSVAALI
jgi:hypothetical protein